MKKKIILIAIIGAILSIVIYFYTKSDELTLTALGDGFAQGMTAYDIEGTSYNDYLKEDLIKNHKLNAYYEYAYANTSVKDLIHDIKDNKKIIYKNKYVEIKHAINEADILTIAIGMDELSKNKITSKVKKDFQNELEELFSMIKMLNTNKVIVLSLYKTNDIDIYNLERLNAIIRDISLSNGFTFIDISKTLNNPDYYLINDNYYINYLGHEAIFNEIKKVI